MGLSYDPNRTITIPNNRSKIKVSLLSNEDEWQEEIIADCTVSQSRKLVAEVLEQDAKAPRERKFKLPNGQVEWLTYLMKKYKNNFKGMARDKRNYNQETWKQLRQKIKRFMTIPEQYNEFVRQNGPYNYDLHNSPSDDEI